MAISSSLKPVAARSACCALQVREHRGELGIVPVRLLGDPVVCQREQVRVDRVEVQESNRDAIQPELLGGLVPSVTGNDLAVRTAGQDRRSETEPPDALGDRGHGVVVLAGVVLPDGRSAAMIETHSAAGSTDGARLPPGRLSWASGHALGLELGRRSRHVGAVRATGL